MQASPSAAQDLTLKPPSSNCAPPPPRDGGAAAAAELTYHSTPPLVQCRLQLGIQQLQNFPAPPFPYPGVKDCNARCWASADKQYCRCQCALVAHPCHRGHQHCSTCISSYFGPSSNNHPSQHLLLRPPLVSTPYQLQNLQQHPHRLLLLHLRPRTQKEQLSDDAR